MARLTTTRQVPLDQVPISVTEVPGLTAQNVRELQLVGIANLDQAFKALKERGGDFTGMAETAHPANFPIDHAESDHIGDCLLAHQRCPEETRKDFGFTSTSVTATMVPSTPQDKSQRGFLASLFLG